MLTLPAQALQFFFVFLSNIDTYFLATLIPMILTLVMFALEYVYEVSLDVSSYAESYKDLKNHGEKFFMLLWSLFKIISKFLLIPIWPVYTLFKTSLRKFYAEAYPSDPKKDIEEIEKLTKISNRAHLIEVKETLYTNVQNFYLLKIHLN